MEKIAQLRGGRTLVTFMNFDRGSIPQSIPGLATQFQSDVKEALYRVLKESVGRSGKIDLFLYTRGGDVNAVWPIVSLLREFDPEFEVLVPFRCHSGGTLVALGAKRIVVGPLSELSPIDPSTGNQFNPVDPGNAANRLAISVEDVKSYREFIATQFVKAAEDVTPETLAPFLEKLTTVVHPLALGNVHRVHQQIKQLAEALLKLHPVEDRDIEQIIRKMTAGFFSHVHMITRHEAQHILGPEQIVFASDDLADAMDALLGQHKKDFALYRPFVLSEHMGDNLQDDVRFIGGVVESKAWSYLCVTKLKVGQRSKLPANVQVQLPPGQLMPLVPGFPREYDINITAQGWTRNEQPQGVTL